MSGPISARMAAALHPHPGNGAQQLKLLPVRLQLFLNLVLECFQLPVQEDHMIDTLLNQPSMVFRHMVIPQGLHQFGYLGP